ncbi:MAG: acyloxyacyl hydrolase [Bacteroidales bacterium]|nr:acyloxyacyl hydrolase [Bacteroidales bacterium]
MKHYIKLLLFALITTSFVTPSANAADTLRTKLPRNKYLSVRYLHGPVYDHRGLSGVLDFHSTDGVGFEYLVETDGSRAWENIYGHPRLGAAFYYEDFHYDVLGKAFSNAVIAEFPLVKRGFFGMDMRFLAGTGYVTKKFDSETNPDNLLVGSRFSAFFVFGPQFQFFMNRPQRLLMGFNFVHWSNGAMRLPNLGLNLMQWHIGVQGRIGGEKPRFQGEPVETIVYNKWQKYVTAAFGVREANQPEGPKYCILSTTAGIYRMMGKRTRIGAGLDFFRDPSQLKKFGNSGIEYSDGSPCLLGLHFAYGFCFGRTTATLHLGGFLFNEIYDELPIYDRLVINYHITPHIMANLGLRTYFMRAEYIEWGVGYVF